MEFKILGSVVDQEMMNMIGILANIDIQIPVLEDSAK